MQDQSAAGYRVTSPRHNVSPPPHLRYCFIGEPVTTQHSRSHHSRFRQGWKFSTRSTPYLFAFYMASIMALLMSLVITAANAGIDADYPRHVLAAYRLAMPTAFCCVLVVRPLVMRLVAWSVHPN
ncbi:MAG: DUF2798 domain-containing protein [Paludibacter sp.]